ncbi:MAG TPA: hypothetical protein VIL27_00775 [Clostridia bacterium]
MARGGERNNAGRPRSPIAEKVLEGNPGKRPLQVILFFDLGIEFQPLQDNRMNSFLQLCLDERRYSQ